MKKINMRPLMIGNSEISGLVELSRVITADLNSSVRASNISSHTEDGLNQTFYPQGYKFKVKVVKNTSKQPFLMCVYPNAKDLEEFAPKLVKALTHDVVEFANVWSRIPNWHIEIDSRLIDQTSDVCVDNGRQFVAIIAHELGHIMNTHPVILAHNYQLGRAQYKMFDKLILGKDFISLLFLPMFVAAAGFHIVTKTATRDVDEIMADARVPMEFKGDLAEYMQYKILNKPYSAAGLIMTKSEYDNEMEKGVHFTRNTIALMRRRRNVLKLHLSTQFKLSESPYYKEICKITSSIVTGDHIEDQKKDLTRDKYLMERFDRVWEEATKEAKIALEAIKVTDRDIVLLGVDIETMKTPSDKTHILNTIYDYLEALEANRNPKNNKNAKIKNANLIPDEATYTMKVKKLREMEKRVISTPVSDELTHYGVFVKYPAGYEG